MPEPYWNTDIQQEVCDTIEILLSIHNLEHPTWELETESRKSQNLWEFLQKFDAARVSLDESEVLDVLLSNHYNDQVPKWLFLDTLGQLRQTQTRCQTLESKVDSISKRFSAFANDISKALLAYHNPPYSYNDTRPKRLGHLSAALQKYMNSDKDTPQPISSSGSTPGCLDMNDRYKSLAERMQALEETVKENRSYTESSIVTAEDSRIAGIQELERKMQAYQSTFAALSDASESSTCTLTPASTVINEPTDEANDTISGNETPAAPLDLHVTVHTDGLIHRHDRPGPTQRIIVKTYPNTPFKILADKLSEKWGDRELRLSELPCEYVFDSDTPVSLKLKEGAKLMYAKIHNGAKTMDLTI